MESNGFYYDCPHCNAKILCPAECAGVVVQCPTCNEDIVPEVPETAVNPVPVAVNPAPAAVTVQPVMVQVAPQAIPPTVQQCLGCGNRYPASVAACPKCGRLSVTMGVGYPQKSRLVYILWAFFLGCFGAHNFYSGHSGSGVAKLLLTFFTSGIASPLVSIWILIEIFAVTSDANGIPFKKLGTAGWVIILILFGVVALCWLLLILLVAAMLSSLAG